MNIWKNIKEFFSRIGKAIEEYNERKIDREEERIKALKKKEELIKQTTRVQRAANDLKRERERSKDKSREEFPFLKTQKNNNKNKEFDEFSPTGII